MKDFDCYLLTPTQREELRAEGVAERSHSKISRIIFLSLLSEIVLSFLLSFFLSLFVTLSGGDPLTDLPAWTDTAMALFSTTGMVAVILFSFRRDPGRVGCKGPFPAEYPAGLLAGFGIFTGAVGLCVLTGTLDITGISPAFVPVPWLLIFVGFLFQGLSEELLCRGVLMLSFTRAALTRGQKNAAGLGLLLSALIFAALHLGNDGISLLAFVNLLLFGVFAGLYYLWRESIWGIAAFHSIWNFTQGNVFGILVSGGSFGTSLFSSVSTPEGGLVNGGSFGLEGGLAVTVVLVLGIAFILWRNTIRIARTPGAAPVE